MIFGSVGTNLSGLYADGVRKLGEDLEVLEGSGADFVEVWPQNLGVILGGRLDAPRLRAVGEVLLETELTYTVHAPLEVNLMDMTSGGLQRDVLDAALEFASEIGAGVVVCHAGQRLGARDARYSLGDQLSAERSALREAGDRAGEMGVTIAVENYYPEEPVRCGAVYDYSVWPSELAEQISAVDHPAVGVCLDVGHAALAAGFFGFDFIQECVTIAPLVRHVHLHDNLQRNNLMDGPPVSEHTVYGLGDLHLPPGRGNIPLRELLGRTDFPGEPSCCVELSPDHFSSVPEALDTARELCLAAATRDPVSVRAGV